MRAADQSDRELVERLDVNRVDEIFSIVEEVSASGDVKPPGFEFSRSDAARLLEASDNEPLRETCGAFGVLDDFGSLHGFVALQELELDGALMLEFMIFFRLSARGLGLPLRAAREVIQQVRALVDLPIVTLVVEGNARGKRFYESAGFRFDRHVLCDGFKLELWRLTNG